MALLLDGNSEQVAHEGGQKGVFGEKKIRVVIALDLIKCQYTYKITEMAPYVRTYF